MSEPTSSTSVEDSAGAGPAAGAAPSWRDRARQLGPVGILSLLALSLPPLGGFALLGTLYWIDPWLAGMGAAGLLLYVAGFILLAGFALMPTYALAVLGGWAFGFAVGFPAALAGFTGAAVMAFLGARYLSGRRLVDMIGENPKWQAVYDELIASTTWRTLILVTLLRIPPNSPFAMCNVALAAARTSLLPFVVGTMVGMAPRTGVIVFAAAGISELDLTRPAQSWMIVAGIIVSLIVVIVLGLWANNAIRKVANGSRVG